MRATLYEYVILYHPKPKKDAAGNEEPVKSAMVQDVMRTLAMSEQEVTILAARQIPSDYLDKLDQVEIRIRPF